MAKILCRFILVLIFLHLTQTLSSAETKVRVGVYGNRPLLFYDSTADRPRGIFIDILEEVARQEDWQLEYVTGGWSDLIGMLGRSEIDLLPAIAYTDNRAALYNYTYETVITNWAVLYTSPSVEITSILELQNQKIGVKQGDIHHKALQELTSKLSLNSRFVEADSYLTVMEMLDAEYVKVGVVNRLFGINHQKEFQIKETPILFNPVEIRFASPKKSRLNIIPVLDRYLSAMKRDDGSVFHGTVNKWLMVEASTKFPVYLIYYLAIAASLAMVFFLAAFRLRLKVKERNQALISANRQLTSEIKERQEKEEELSKLAEIVSASDDFMALFNNDGVHLIVNDSYLRFAEQIAGLKEVIGLHAEDVFGKQFFQDEMKHSFSQCRQGVIKQNKTIYQTLNSEQLCLHMKFSPSMSPGNRASGAGVVLDIRDVTEQWKLEESLKNAQKMEALGILAGSVAHDLNNILSGVVGYPDLLLSELTSGSRMYDPLMTIKQSGEKAAAVVGDLLTLARRSVDNRMPLDFNSVVKEFLDSPEHRAMVTGNPGLSYRLALSASECVIIGNQTQLSKVIMNLVLNCIESMPNGGVISIGTEKNHYQAIPTTSGHLAAGDYVCLTVADSGVGISEKTVSRIFEPFYTSKVMGKSGTGLGMAIVYGIVKDHEGFIDIHSKPAEGTKFTIYFPVTNERVDSKTENDVLQRWHGHGEHILVIDDLADQRQIASEMLTQIGYVAHSAPSGEAGVEFIKGNRIDLVILDMIMPGGMDGLSTYREIIKVNSSLPTIIASGFSQSDHVYKAQRMGAGLYLKKPYTLLELAKAVNSSMN